MSRNGIARICVLEFPKKNVEKSEAMSKSSLFAGSIAVTLLLGAGVAIAGSTWDKDDPSKWTTEDVYKLLNNSPWSKSVRVTGVAQSGRTPGGMGRGGLGGMGGGMGGMGGGMGRRRSGYPPAEQSTEVIVQWQSALPVRLAEARQDSGSADAAAMKPLREYVIAVLGLPTSRLLAKGPSGDSGSDDTDDANIAERLKSITVLSVSHEHLNPVKVELNQGRDGRAIFHFERSEPITLQDKSAEFRITGERAEIKQKFALKDMEFQGKLAL